MAVSTLTNPAGFVDRRRANPVLATLSGAQATVNHWTVGSNVNLEVGQIVDCVSAIGGTLRGQRTITAIAGTDITYNGADITTDAAGDLLIPANYPQRVASALVGVPANWWNVDAMRARLIVLNGSYYTTARLDQMSENDMVFALRTLDSPGSI